MKKTSFTELINIEYNDMIMYQRKLDELLIEKILGKSVYNIFKCNELKVKIKDCSFRIDKLKPKVRQEKINIVLNKIKI